jgi:hypothetical protein
MPEPPASHARLALEGSLFRGRAAAFAAVSPGLDRDGWLSRIERHQSFV